MGRRLRRLGLMVLLLGGVALGCTKAAVQHKEPPDPLLVTKKPVEGRPRPADAPHDAPLPPPLPDHERFPLSVQGDGPDPSRPALLGIESIRVPNPPGQGPTGR
jgi:hypothetical protein